MSRNTSLFTSGPLFEEIFGSELLFLGVGVGRVFFGAVLPMLLLYYLVFCSRKCLGKILLMSFSFKRESFGSNRAQPHTHLGCFFLFFFCPAALVCSPFLAVRPASWRFFGVPFWAPRIFGILLELTGLELARPF